MDRKMIADMQMPAKKSQDPMLQMEEMDLGMEEEAMEEAAAMDLSGASDDDLIAELKKRGFEVEQEEEAEAEHEMREAAEVAEEVEEEEEAEEA